MKHSILSKDLKSPHQSTSLIDTSLFINKTPSQSVDPVFEVGDLLVAYLKQLNIDYVFGVPGGAIEPLYNALARSERNAGPRSVVARHESGAAFMADGYYRNSGKLGVCCTTTGPGATNAITGVAMAYENDIPLLIITAQTALPKFGKKALQESTDTGVNTIGMFEHCTLYSSMVSHVEQFETKLISAVMTAFGSRKGPVHLSIPLDILRTVSPISEPSYNLQELITPHSSCDNDSIHKLSKELIKSKNPVFVIGCECTEAAGTILNAARIINAKIITTPDGKGLVSPYHPQYKGVIGFAGHQSATDLLSNQGIDLIVVIGTTLGEWTSNGWDQDTLLNHRLIHVDATEDNLTRSPMAHLHVRGRLLTIFERVTSILNNKLTLFQLNNLSSNITPAPQHKPFIKEKVPNNEFSFKMENIDHYKKACDPIKPQWLMGQLTKLFPPNTKYLADAGNSFAWAAHYLHPVDRRFSNRRQKKRNDNGRRQSCASLFQAAIEYSSMGWAIGSAIGAALAAPKNPIVAITGDGSWLMSGQEITTALQEKLCIIYIILNDSALGMVKHGQRLAGAEPTSFELPTVNFQKMAVSVGANGYLIQSYKDLLSLDINAIINSNKPSVIDIRIDPEQVPPMGLRMKVLQNQK